VTESARNPLTVVSVDGELDVGNAPELRTRLDEAADQATDLLIVDLLDVTFMDSTALGVLIGAAKRCEQRGVEQRLVLREPRILKVFEITGLRDVFSIHPTVAAATAASRP
jgi:anti-sigma B factor antagonist